MSSEEAGRRDAPPGQPTEASRAAGTAGVPSDAGRLPYRLPRRPVLLLAIPVAIVVILVIALVSPFASHGPGPYTPEVAGIIASIESLGGGVARLDLENGQTFTAKLLDSSTTAWVYGSGPSEGQLLLAGRTAEGPWFATISRGDLTSYFGLDCYHLDDNGTDQGDWIQTDRGLHLRKTPDFDPGLLSQVPGGPVPTAHPGLRYRGPQQTFCLNAEGLVTDRR